MADGYALLLQRCICLVTGWYHFFDSLGWISFAFRKAVRLHPGRLYVNYALNDLQQDSA